MKILIDVNLPPAWTQVFATNRIDAVHWTSVGDPRAADEELMRYARQHEYVLFTHDLDFGTLLAMTRALGPSVLQLRAQNVLPEAVGGIVLRVLTEHAASLDAGALITVDDHLARVRILPIR
jgi:predicted nuclease of predicted toxin-antitoxin system